MDLISYLHCISITFILRLTATNKWINHHVVPLTRISLTLFSLSFIASGRSSGLHPVSSHSCCMYVWAGHPAFAWPYAGVHRSTSLMSSSLLLQQCPVCLARLTCIVFVMGGRWPYSWCLFFFFLKTISTTKRLELAIFWFEFNSNNKPAHETMNDDIKCFLCIKLSIRDLPACWRRYLVS